MFSKLINIVQVYSLLRNLFLICYLHSHNYFLINGMSSCLHSSLNYLETIVETWICWLYSYDFDSLVDIHKLRTRSDSKSSRIF